MSLLRLRFTNPRPIIPTEEARTKNPDHYLAIEGEKVEKLDASGNVIEVRKSRLYRIKMEQRLDPNYSWDPATGILVLPEGQRGRRPTAFSQSDWDAYDAATLKVATEGARKATAKK